MRRDREQASSWTPLDPTPGATRVEGRARAVGLTKDQEWFHSRRRMALYLLYGLPALVVGVVWAVQDPGDLNWIPISVIGATALLNVIETGRGSRQRRDGTSECSG